MSPSYDGLPGCSIALSVAPFDFSSLTMSCKSPIERANRSIRVTTKLSSTNKGQQVPELSA